MTILTWCLYLVVTILILFPAVMFTSSLIFGVYFELKEKHIAKTVKQYSGAVLAAIKVMEGAKAKKE